MAVCQSCWLDFDDAAHSSCPTCTTQCPKCGTFYSTQMLEMCPECRATELGEMEIPSWFQGMAAEHNRKVRRNRWILGLTVLGIVIVAIMIIG